MAENGELQTTPFGMALCWRQSKVAIGNLDCTRSLHSRCCENCVQTVPNSPESRIIRYYCSPDFSQVQISSVEQAIKLQGASGRVFSRLRKNLTPQPERGAEGTAAPTERSSHDCNRDAPAGFAAPG
jgi:hypothetical protein